ncbi:uncharacterized protein [Nicotiana tomentosiformis]|uniref:uncharacterized protein isoform X4 n=1 Tax=Nicotiana tomentosiformis TaxID=4098 RepID=UPI00388C4D6E
MPLGCGLWHYGSRKILSLSSACLLRSPQATRLRLQKSTKFSCWSNPCPLGSGILPTRYKTSQGLVVEFYLHLKWRANISLVQGELQAIFPQVT